jgi:ubiquinone/menaquinone biosynthesis C-methylase UbiE
MSVNASMSLKESFRSAVVRYSEGDMEGALKALEGTQTNEPREVFFLQQVKRFLSQRKDSTELYVDPSGFEAFTRGGSNVALYEAVHEALGKLYASRGSDLSLLDVGCGEGAALVPALKRAQEAARAEGREEFPLKKIALLEPSSMLAACERKLREAAEALGISVEVESISSNIEQVCSSLEHFSFVESSFALQNVNKHDRARVLSELAKKCDVFVLIEFDCSAIDLSEAARFEDRTIDGFLEKYIGGVNEFNAQLSESYGLSENQMSAAIEGFLVPILFHNFTGHSKLNEQSAAQWLDELRTTFSDVRVQTINEYWWAPCVMFTCTNQRSN